MIYWDWLVIWSLILFIFLYVWRECKREEEYTAMERKAEELYEEYRRIAEEIC